MKIIGVFLLFISSSIADDLCEERWDGDCKPWIEPCGTRELSVGFGHPLCPPFRKCCTHVCEAKWDGKCRAAANCGGDIKVNQPGICPVGQICCVDEDDTPCDKQMDGKCANSCGALGPNYARVGSNHPDRDCLCPDDKECCVKKNDRCKDVKGGKCRTLTQCQKRGGKKTVPNLCNVPGKICCVPDPPCERRPNPGNPFSRPMGICIETKHCPDGYQTAEERCIRKPFGVSQWCLDDDELCCVHP